MASTTATSARKDAVRAARELLAARTQLIGEAAAALAERHRIAAQLADADTAYATAYAAALDGGWTDDDLTQLGLEPPAGINTTRRRLRAVTPAQRHAGDAPEPAGNGGDDGPTSTTGAASS